MVEVECVSCRAPLPPPPARDGARGVAACVRCGATQPAVDRSGPETVALPPLAGRRRPVELDLPFAGFDGPIPTGTAVLIPEPQRPATPSPANPQTVRRASLIIEGESRTSMPLAGESTRVGRRGTHIVIADPTLSALHFVIEAIGERYVLRDLDSSNGTRLNGRPVREARLQPGDRIDAGRTRFVFHVEESIPWDRPS